MTTLAPGSVVLGAPPSSPSSRAVFSALNNASPATGASPSHAAGAKDAMTDSKNLRPAGGQVLSQRDSDEKPAAPLSSSQLLQSALDQGNYTWAAQIITAARDKHAAQSLAQQASFGAAYHAPSVDSGPLLSLLFKSGLSANECVRLTPDGSEAAALALPLFYVAVWRNHKELLPLFDRAGCNVRQGTEHHPAMTALHAAAVRDATGSLQVLHSLGVPTDGVNATGETALHLALAFQHVATVRTLLAMQAPLERRTGAVAPPKQRHPLPPPAAGKGLLISTADFPDLGHLYLLLKPPPQQLPPYSVGLTPLHLAACANSPELVALLLAAGASPAARNAVGETPLDYARAHSVHTVIDLSVEQLLLSAAARDAAAAVAAASAGGPPLGGYAAATMAWYGGGGAGGSVGKGMELYGGMQPPYMDPYGDGAPSQLPPHPYGRQPAAGPGRPRNAWSPAGSAGRKAPVPLPPSKFKPPGFGGVGRSDKSQHIISRSAGAGAHAGAAPSDGQRHSKRQRTDASGTGGDSERSAFHAPASRAGAGGGSRAPAGGGSATATSPVPSGGAPGEADSLAAAAEQKVGEILASLYVLARAALGSPEGQQSPPGNGATPGAVAPLLLPDGVASAPIGRTKPRKAVHKPSAPAPGSSDHGGGYGAGAARAPSSSAAPKRERPAAAAPGAVPRKQHSGARTQERLMLDLIAMILAGKQSQKDLLAAESNIAATFGALKRLQDEQLVARLGRGGRNDPFYFAVTEIGEAALKEGRIPDPPVLTEETEE